MPGQAESSDIILKDGMAYIQHDCTDAAEPEGIVAQHIVATSSLTWISNGY